MCFDGGLFLPSARGTMVHALLTHCRDGLRVEHCYNGTKRKYISIWPSASSLDLRKAKQQARQHFKIYEAFFDSHFPGFGEQCMFACFDLSDAITWEQRRNFLRLLSARRGLRSADVEKDFFGAGQPPL